MWLALMDVISALNMTTAKRIVVKRRLKGELVVRARKCKYGASNYCGEDATYPFRCTITTEHVNDPAGASSGQPRKNEPLYRFFVLPKTTGTKGFKETCPDSYEVILLCSMDPILYLADSLSHVDLHNVKGDQRGEPDDCG